jgi:hypothetical protein
VVSLLARPDRLGLKPWGSLEPRWIGSVDTRWLPDGRSMLLLADVCFVDSRGWPWWATKGRVVNGHSIPWILWNPFVGTPFTGKGRDGSVIHDVACQDKTEPWEDVHRAYWEACLSKGMWAPRARMFYGGVWVGGPRWEL